MELAQRGIACGVARVARLLKNQGLRAIPPKSFPPKTTDSRHRLGYSPNLLLDEDDPVRVNQLWLGDITYIPLAGGGFAYLALLMDRYSRRIIAWISAKTCRKNSCSRCCERPFGRVGLARG